tara:strand:- start:2263 stop:2877 length:615 start_codon:yes stop_codon:yes gene_type:complete
MFTGIVSEQGQVSNISKHVGFLSLRIKTSEKFQKGLIGGASVSVNGVCLTFKKKVGKNIEFDVIKETLNLTNLGKLKLRSMVNLERSMKASSEIGGHLVSGHIQGMGIVTKIEEISDQVKDIKIKLPKNLMQYVIYKGYIAVNGCSLTIGAVTKTEFTIHLIPETLKITNLSKIKKGDKLNIEIDQSTITTVKTIQQYLAGKNI